MGIDVAYYPLPLVFLTPSFTLGSRADDDSDDSDDNDDNDDDDDEDEQTDAPADVCEWVTQENTKLKKKTSGWMSMSEAAAECSADTKCAGISCKNEKK